MAAAAHGDCREAAPTLGITECTNTSRPLGFRHQVLQAILLQKSCSNKKKDLLTKLVFDGDCAHEVEPFRGERYSLIFFIVEKLTFRLPILANSPTVHKYADSSLRPAASKTSVERWAPPKCDNETDAEAALS